MVVCRTTKSEGGERDGYTLAASGRTFDDFDDAVEHAETIAPSRAPRVLAQVWPHDDQDIYVDDEGRQFLFLAETARKKEGPLVWLLDEDDKRVGMTKSMFERKMRRKEE